MRVGLEMEGITYLTMSVDFSSYTLKTRFCTESVFTKETFKMWYRPTKLNTVSPRKTECILNSVGPYKALNVLPFDISFVQELLF